MDIKLQDENEVWLLEDNKFDKWHLSLAIISHRLGMQNKTLFITGFSYLLNLHFLLWLKMKSCQLNGKFRNFQTLPLSLQFEQTLS